jgi:hypothetical protein
MLHSPPSEFGFSRTTWKSTQPQQALRYIGLALSTRDISGVSRGYYDGCRGRTGGPASIVRIQAAYSLSVTQCNIGPSGATRWRLGSYRAYNDAR